MESSRHITDGVAKQAKTSSVLLKCVRCGSTMGCPRHCPHIYTWPLWDFAAEVCVEWQAAISTILVEGRGGVKTAGRHGGGQGGGAGTWGRMWRRGHKWERTKGRGGIHQSDPYISIIFPLEITGLLVFFFSDFMHFLKFKPIYLIIAEITVVTYRVSTRELLFKLHQNRMTYRKLPLDQQEISLGCNNSH